MLKGQAIQKFHRDEGLVLVLADLVDRADIRMVQGRGNPCFAAEAFKCVGIIGNVFGKELEPTKRPRSVSSALYTTPIPPPPSFSTMR
jgi:hypothetical protein